MPARLVGPGDPAGAIDYPRIDEIANIVVPQCLRSDVALDQERVPGEVVVVEQRVVGRFQRGASLLSSTSRSPGTPMASSSQSPPGWRTLTRTFFSVSAAVTVGPGRPRSPRPPGWRWSGCHRCRGPPPRAARRSAATSGRAVIDRFDVGRVTRLQAPHEGVLTDGAFGQELLGGAAAHGAGHRGHDDVADPQPIEDALVGLPVRVVGGLEPGTVDVEGVGVLHDELPGAQDAGSRPRLVTVFALDLVQHQREVLVGAVLALDGQGEQLFVCRAQQVVVAATVAAAETRCRRIRSTGSWSRTARAAAGRGTGSPARQWRSSRRGRRVRCCAAPAARAAASCTARARRAGCSPARISSLWLGTSASAGSSRRVRRNSLDIRVITAGKPNGDRAPGDDAARIGPLRNRAIQQSAAKPGAAGRHTHAA